MVSAEGRWESWQLKRIVGSGQGREVMSGKKCSGYRYSGSLDFIDLHERSSL